MSLDIPTRASMEQRIAHTSPAPDIWNTSWTGILTSLFSSSHNYMVIPRGGNPVSGSQVPDFIFEAAKGTFAPGPSGSTPILSLRTVLVIEERSQVLGSWKGGDSATTQTRNGRCVFRGTVFGVGHSKTEFILDWRDRPSLGVRGEGAWAGCEAPHRVARQYLR